jgi:hypothetical protein
VSSAQRKKCWEVCQMRGVTSLWRTSSACSSNGWII